MRIFIMATMATFFALINVSAQDPLRFAEEIQDIKSKPIPKSAELAVFTGSSSMRLWDDLEIDCTNIPLVNTGFGGSQMSDLLYHIDVLVLRYNPSTVYIYEGDNDINDGKSPKDIMETTKQVVSKILSKNKHTKIYLISAKPSPSRWQFKKAYEEFNLRLKYYCNSHSQLNFIDVWTPMLNKKGRPIPNIFVEDSLHMNRKGYDIWKKSICLFND